MGQYYKIINVDKRQILCPWAFGNGAKLMEWSYQGNVLVNALFNLLQGDWSGDRVYVVGDYADLSNDGRPEVWQPTLEKIEKELGFHGLVADKNHATISEGCPITLYGYASEHFEELTPEDVITERIDKYARYIFNNKLQCVIDLAKLPVTYEGFNSSEGKPCRMYISPLSLLLAMGNGRGGGDYHEDYPGFETVGSWCETSQYIEISDNMLHPEYDDFLPGFTENLISGATPKDLFYLFDENTNITFINREGDVLGKREDIKSVEDYQIDTIGADNYDKNGIYITIFKGGE